MQTIMRVFQTSKDFSIGPWGRKSNLDWGTYNVTGIFRGYLR
jgi:hypothetical protein